MFIALVLAAGIASFPGGDANDLAKNLDLKLSAEFRLKVTCHLGDIGGKPGVLSFEFTDN